MNVVQGAIFKKLKESYSMDKALIPILEQHLRHGGQYAHVNRCMQKILRETRQKAGRTQEYLKLLKNHPSTS